MRFVGRTLARLLRGLSLLWLVCACSFANLLRGLFKGARADYVLFELSGPLPELTPQRPWFMALGPLGRPSLTVESLHSALRQIAEDPDVRGVLFLVKGSQISLAQAQTLADLFDRFRGWSRALYPGAPPKEVVVHLESCGGAEYMMSAAADRVSVAPRTEWMVLGLRAEPVFLADTLRKVGVRAEVVKVAPWKTAADTLERSEISPAHREQLERLLNGWFDELVAAISRGRDMNEEQVRSAIDSAPLTAEEAVQLGLIDELAYEDQLAAKLAATGKDARVLPFEEARKALYRRPLLRHKRSLGVISLNGMITSGKSRRFPAGLPLLGGSTIGSVTVQQTVRTALENDRLAGILLHVDSSGGSALASDLIWRELTLLNRKKPVVAYLGDVAGSGGYYVALPAQKIICQPTTLTGSIGVIMAKIVAGEALAKIGANRFAVQRGENADIYASDRPWRPEQREKVEEQIGHTYGRFRNLVADARQLAPESLESVCGGRVWTGRQAHERGLVDEMGDFATAIDRLCELAELPQDGSVPVIQVTAPQNRTRPPLSERSLEQMTGAGSLADLTDALLALLQGDISSLLGRERIWLLADGLPKSR